MQEKKEETLILHPEIGRGMDLKRKECYEYACQQIFREDNSSFRREKMVEMGRRRANRNETGGGAD